MTDPSFYDKLSIVRQQVGDQIPPNILEYFLKQSGGDINHCISLLKENYDKRWDKSDDNLPERSVHLLHQTNRPSHTPPTQPITTSLRHSDKPHSQYSHAHQSLHPQNMGVARQHKISPPPYNIGVSHGFEPIPYSIQDQQQVDIPQPFESAFRRDLNPSPHLSSRRLPESMPVRVPYKGGGVAYNYNAPPTQALNPGGVNNTKFNSFTERTLMLQREQLQKAKNEYEALHKVYTTAQNEVKEMQQELNKMKRSISQSNINEEELYMAECINSSLKYDISKEKEKKRQQKFPAAPSSSWQCPHCSWSNTPLVSTCDKCPYTKP